MQIEIAGVALHVVQRGSGGGLCFQGNADRSAYLRWLARTASRERCAIHAYVLMGNHVHLLLTPHRGSAVTALLSALRERHAGFLREAAGGPIVQPWEARFDAAPVYAPRYLFACMRYIELNPVRAGIVRRAADFRWSSHRANACGAADPIVTPHPAYLALGRTVERRRAVYREMVFTGRPGEPPRAPRSLPVR